MTITILTVVRALSMFTLLIQIAYILYRISKDERTNIKEIVTSGEAPLVSQI